MMCFDNFEEEIGLRMRFLLAEEEEHIPFDSSASVECMQGNCCSSHYFVRASRFDCKVGSLGNSYPYHSFEHNRFFFNLIRKINKSITSDCNSNFDYFDRNYYFLVCPSRFLPCHEHTCTYLPLDNCLEITI